MTTLGDMAGRISDELARSDLESPQTYDAIRSAINHYAGERWWFNESLSFTICVSTATDSYSLPANFERADELNLILSGPLILPIEQQAFDTISQWQTGLVTGQPTDFAIYQETIIYFPAPDANYTTLLSYVTSVSTLTGTTSTNAFMTYGEELIRSRARADIQINFLRDEGATTEYMIMLQSGLPFYSHRERVAYSSLRAKATRRLTTGRIQGSGW